MINKQKRMFKYFFVLVSFVASMNGFAQTTSNRLPNIIYIFADDLGYGELGCYGQKKIKTPNLDRLAKEGMRFTQHYTSAPVCAPARAMLMTGKHGGHSYIRGNLELGGYADSIERGQMPLPGNAYTIADLVKTKGYKTALIGKWGLGMNTNEGSPLKHGFDYYYGYLDQKQAHNYYPTHLWENGKWDTLNQSFINVHRKLDSTNATDSDFQYFQGKEYAPAKMTDKATAFIEKNKEAPFFLYLPYTLPHVSLQAPDDYVKRYVGLFAENPYYGQQGYASAKYPLSAHAAMITYLDDQAGIIINKIKELGLDENTIILFSSDNGASTEGGVDTRFFNSNGNLRGLKRDLYEGGIRMPFIARWPGTIPAGTTSDLISAQYDFFETVADIISQEMVHTDGISFLNELKGENKKQKKHRHLYFEFAENGGQVAIRKGAWKAVKSNLKKNPNALWELYNLSTDQGETINVAAHHISLLKQFDKILEKEHQPTDIKDWEFISTYQRQH